jgi:hypothetical protein
MQRLLSVRTTRNVLVPGWIATFGFVALAAPPLGVAASLSLFVVGVVVVPALLMIPRRPGRQLVVVKIVAGLNS